ncbi:MAG: hypothetical protein K0Q55_995 [Verrucomicrobia bacterium]|jgi:hypothetical protein|nr:hypothetical protein [Verrucomicrobiota bacterium]
MMNVVFFCFIPFYRPWFSLVPVAEEIIHPFARVARIVGF